MTDWEQPRSPRGRRRLRIVAGAGIALLAGATLVASGLGRGGAPGERADPDEITVETRGGDPPDSGAEDPTADTGARDPTADTGGNDPTVNTGTDGPSADTGAGGSPANAGQAGRAVGEWQTLADAPIMRRSEALAVWTGLEVLVWGGREGGWHADGAAYDPARDRWRELPPAPAAASPQAGAVWTGREMVVAGAADGAALAYDPESDVWRELPAPPVRLGGPATVVWNGTEAVVVGYGGARSEAGEREPRAVAYDPSRNSWRELPDPPLDGFGLEPRAAAAGDRVAVLGEVADATGWAQLAMTAYDPAEDRWSDPDVSSFGSVGGTWFLGTAAEDRGERIAVAGSAREGTWRFRAAFWDPEGSWDLLPSLEADGHGFPKVAAFPRGVLVWTGTLGAEGWLLTNEGWRPLPVGPLRPRHGAAVVWTGYDLIVWGGRQGTHAHDDGMRWRPRDRTLEYCCSP